MNKWERDICALRKWQISILIQVTPQWPIGVHLYATRDEGYRKGVSGDGKFLQETFLPCLFFEKLKTLPPIVGSLSML